jgi:hypothetical protein
VIIKKNIAWLDVPVNNWWILQMKKKAYFSSSTLELKREEKRSTN